MTAPVAAEPLDVGEVYQTCLIGRFAVEYVLETVEPWDAAVEACSELGAAVPDDYPWEPAESYGRELPEENAIHFIDSLLSPRLN